MNPAVIGGGLKLLGGLFGRKKSPTPSQNIVSQAKGARLAAEKYGFNALTLLQYGQPGGAMGGGGAPPLASQAILEGIADITDVMTGEAATRREHNELANDLLRVQLDEARARAQAGPSPGVAAVGSGPAALGRRAVPVGNVFLDETMAAAVQPEGRDNTVSMQSHGSETVVPVGPDVEEVLTGWVIDANNRRKADKARLDRAGGWTVGTPLRMPTKGVPAGLGGTVFIDDPAALLPPKPYKVRPKARPLSNHLVPLNWHEQQFQ